MIEFNMPWEFGFPFRKSPQGKHILKTLASQIKYIQTGLHVDQGIHKPDVIFVKVTNFELGNMGSSSLTSHGKGKSHEFKVKDSKKLAHFFKPN